MKNKKITQSERLRIYMEAAMYQVMDWLKWDEMQYNAFKYKCGREYLKIVLGDEESAQMVACTKEFWGWWRLRWYQREQDWLQACEHHRIPTMVISISNELEDERVAIMNDSAYSSAFGRKVSYQELHRPMTLATNKEMNDSYCRDLITELNRRKTA